MDLTFDEVEVRDKASEIFQDEVHNDELLDQYYRGQISEQDLVDRLKFLKKIAENQAIDALAEEVRDGQEMAEAEAYADSDGPWEAA